MKDTKLKVPCASIRVSMILAEEKRMSTCISSFQDRERPPASPIGGTVKWFESSEFLNSLKRASSWFLVSIRKRTAGEMRLRNSLIRWTVRMGPIP